MIRLTLAEIAKATAGQVINCEHSKTVFNNISTDTRKIQSGDLFIALRGESFDAHQFLDKAVQLGAGALLIDQKTGIDLPCILVKDTRIALGLLASYVRQQISGLKCAAITGSNGKTTTKELLSAILCCHAGDSESVLATAGNFNNDIGLPLTLLRLTDKIRYAVVELGANHLGEIAYTAQLTKPDVALINNVMPAHLEGFGSLQGVAQAKGEIWSSLSETGIAVVNLDADFASEYLTQLKKLNRRVFTFSSEGRKAQVGASNIEFSALGKASFELNVMLHGDPQIISIELNLAGLHNVSNALAAATMAIALGCNLKEIQAGLSVVKQVEGRVDSRQLNELVTLIDDTYNANPASVKVAIDLLQQYASAHLLILGDMAELGEFSEHEHQLIGEYAAQKGIEKLMTVGKLTFKTYQAFKQAGQGEALHFADKKQLNAYLENVLSAQNDKLTILVKGSRGSKMEEVVNSIKQAANKLGA
ncbi:UDP-N-acetylmuramoylalanyl-D-glutamyl-2, 6-diaminopimelate--D-alanyl-D-alanine ligase [Psychromonas sp. MB-3u-54]|uniref:UDP-N-acetylmuramoyl-tripeptide--D-alanyl-D- alanine ligase n=1 Tax=Psychromonas sp. MB-3u-54 TaxID=2058319 RepID=UPI000C31D303|nr:UDP-N-acetylmuramoyl-tripeptide--D-alanyl-D-alanine ligase [Psychromonas sp. MB-3u-54]PKH03601.1 UDP-N-acetylmuramoylalanyl-D-glutamyl-2, 6-diaminopimelate--D-alanyl-D-alanine ligase [Psychromonas sp. MB-3u-54]